jgi:hypothetical protein
MFSVKMGLEAAEWIALVKACWKSAGSTGGESEIDVFRLEGLGPAEPAFLTPALWVSDCFPRDLSLPCVSRCCFMLSARVNFFWQPA